MARRGGQAVFLTRFVPVVRTLAPHLAGATRMPYRSITPYSLFAAPLWAGAEVGAGYAAARSVQHAIALGGPALAVTAGLTATAILTAAKVRRRRRTRTAAPDIGPTAAHAWRHFREAPSLPGAGPTGMWEPRTCRRRPCRGPFRSPWPGARRGLRAAA
ncbi:DedA family protein [Streptomyces cinereoruber]|uniref:DedA family protein n=1 Tax=Streptomyces cinereoruber TaxID=67260 RepID=UPI003EBF7492